MTASMNDDACRPVEHLGGLALELFHVGAGNLGICALQGDARFDHVDADELARHADVDLLDVGADLVFRGLERAGDRVADLSRGVPFPVHESIILRHSG